MAILNIDTKSKICWICGKEIFAEPYEVIKTKRGTELYMHSKCIGAEETHGEKNEK